MHDFFASVCHHVLGQKIFALIASISILVSGSILYLVGTLIRSTKLETSIDFSLFLNKINKNNEK